ncbi:efflux RND transporter periplasmic adaptor subunit [Oryzibacter oryziterrae]|uniref:efflux RND transporter periplasmic adaptor subunit n=1 Tax=Oryzibacter oryziterrae TaxID=2766474 RepID=UPI001F02AF32|nr:efflux RND transporter periplasmic adaptor subunit [Oryzibacter oryziterrae]
MQVQKVQASAYTPRFVLTGEVVARSQSDLAFRVGGQVINRKVDVGDHVAAGDLLASLDPKIQEADVAAAAAALQAADVRLRQVNANFERQKALLEQGFTTRRDFDNALQECRSAEAMLAGAQAQLAITRDVLSQTTLKAPAAGTITARFMEVGQVAQPSQPAFVLALDGPRDVVVDVQEAALVAGIRDSIHVALLSNPSVTAKAEIREISPTVSATGAVRIKLALKETPPGMVLGTAVRVTAQAAPRSLFIVPSSALTSIAGKAAVWVVDQPGGTVALRPVEIDVYSNSGLVIAKGLAANDLVVTAGTQLLHPDQKVTFTEARS